MLSWERDIGTRNGSQLSTVSKPFFLSSNKEKKIDFVKSNIFGSEQIEQRRGNKLSTISKRFFLSSNKERNRQIKSISIWADFAAILTAMYEREIEREQNCARSRRRPLEAVLVLCESLSLFLYKHTFVRTYFLGLWKIANKRLF